MKYIRIFVVLIFGMAVFSSSLHADTKKGQRLYLKNCKKCHGNGAEGAVLHTQAEWKKLFANDAQGMIDAHKGTTGEKKITPKFLKKRGKHLFDFLHEYASDSGNVPSC